jgi:hypothetical protein
MGAVFLAILSNCPWIIREYYIQKRIDFTGALTAFVDHKVVITVLLILDVMIIKPLLQCISALLGEILHLAMHEENLVVFIHGGRPPEHPVANCDLMTL